MALSTDTTINFNSSAGYIFNATPTEFTAGVCRLKSGAGATNDTVRTPNIDRSGWADNVNKVEVTLTEAVGYFHRFLVSFDGGTIWEAYLPGGWKRTPLTQIATYGMPLDTLELIRNWRDTDDISFAVYMVRESGGGNGSIDQITVYYGTEAVAFASEPVSFDTLENAGIAETVQNDASDGKDTFLYEGSPTTNFGTDDDAILAEGGGAAVRMIVEITIPDIVSADRVLSAPFTLTGACSLGNAEVQITRLTQPAWTEDGATYNTYNGADAWDTAGGDHAGTPIEVEWINGESSAEFPLASLVVDGIENRSRKLILMIRKTGGSGILTVNSSDHATPENRPKLIINHWFNYQPDFVITPEFSEPVEELETEGGYQIAVKRVTNKRATYPMTWGKRTEADRDAILAFIRAHQDVDFEWTPPGRAAARRFKFAEPEYEMAAPDVWNINCDAIQAFAYENVTP